MVEIYLKQQNPIKILIKSTQIQMFQGKLEMVLKMLIEIRRVLINLVATFLKDSKNSDQKSQLKPDSITIWYD